LKNYIEWLLNLALAIFAGYMVGWPYFFVYLVLFSLGGMLGYLVFANESSAQSTVLPRIVLSAIELLIALNLNWSIETIMSFLSQVQFKLASMLDFSYSEIKPMSSAMEILKAGMIKNSESLKGQAESFNLYNEVFWHLNWWQLTLVVFVTVNLITTIGVYLKNK